MTKDQYNCVPLGYAEIFLKITDIVERQFFCINMYLIKMSNAIRIFVLQRECYPVFETRTQTHTRLHGLVPPCISEYFH